MALLKKTKAKATSELGVVKERKRGASLQVKRSRAGWLFILPFLLGFLLIYIPIIFDSIKYSFHEIDIITGGGYELVWVGLGNYQAALSDETFVQTLLSGLTGLIVEIPAICSFHCLLPFCSIKRWPGVRRSVQSSSSPCCSPPD